MTGHTRTTTVLIYHPDGTMEAFQECATLSILELDNGKIRILETTETGYDEAIFHGLPYTIRNQYTKNEEDTNSQR